MPNFETSFIPEQGTTYQSGAKRSTVATVFSILIILAAGGLSGWVWWQERQEIAKVKALESELSSMESRFDIAKISELGALDKKISVAKGMLDRHPLPSMLIDYISENTVSSIRWKQIAYTRSGGASKAGETGGASGDSIDLTGETNGYSPLYQQLDHFKTKCKEITSVELKSFSIDPRTNNLSIQMRIVVNPNYATVATLRAKSTADAAVKKQAETVTDQAVDNTANNTTSTFDTQPTQPQPAPVQPAKTPVVAPKPAVKTPVKTQPVVNNQNAGNQSAPAVINENQ